MLVLAQRAHLGVVHAPIMSTPCPRRLFGSKRISLPCYHRRLYDGASDPGGAHHVTDVLRAAAETNAEVEAYVEMAEGASGGLVPPGADGRRRLTFGAWDAAADAVAGLWRALGVTKGDVVCLLLPSSIDYAVCYQAAARIGALTTA